MPAYTIINSIREPLFPQSLISSNSDDSWMEINFSIDKSASIKNAAETELENQLPKPNSQARLSTQRVQRSRTTTRETSALWSVLLHWHRTGLRSLLVHWYRGGHCGAAGEEGG